MLSASSFFFSLLFFLQPQTQNRTTPPKKNISEPVRMLHFNHLMSFWIYFTFVKYIQKQWMNNDFGDDKWLIFVITTWDEHDENHI